MALTIESLDSGAGPRVAVLALDGELDASNYESLIDRVRAAHEAGAASLVLDLGELTFMASSGLVALYSAARLMRGDAPPDPELGWGAIHEMEDEAGAESPVVRLAAVQPPVERVLDRTGLRRLFHLDATRADAIAALTGA